MADRYPDADAPPPIVLKTLIVFSAGRPLSMFHGREADVDANVARIKGDDIQVRSPVGTRWEGQTMLDGIPALRYFDENWSPPG